MTDESPRLTAKSMADELAKFASDTDAESLQRYFKTGKGQYGEGDRFIGVRVPMTRKVCRRYANLLLAETKKLLESPVHEHRLAGAILLSVNTRELPKKQGRRYITCILLRLKKETSTIGISLM